MSQAAGWAAGVKELEPAGQSRTEQPDGAGRSSRTDRAGAAQIGQGSARVQNRSGRGGADRTGICSRATLEPLPRFKMDFNYGPERRDDSAGMNVGGQKSHGVAACGS
jgi:hypothetical protein